MKVKLKILILIALSALLFKGCATTQGVWKRYLSYSNNKVMVEYKGNKSRLYDEVLNLVISPDSNHIAFVAASGDRATAVIDFEEQSLYDEVRHLTFSNNSERLAYTARSGKRWNVVVDGRLSKMTYLDVGQPVFSRDSQRAGYAAKPADNFNSLRWFLIVDDIIVDTYHKGTNASELIYAVKKYFDMGNKQDKALLLTDFPMWLNGLNNAENTAPKTWSRYSITGDEVLLIPGQYDIRVFYNAAAAVDMAGGRSEDITLQLNALAGHIYAVEYISKSKSLSELFSPENLNFNILESMFNSTGEIRVFVYDMNEKRIVAK